MDGLGSWLRCHGSRMGWAQTARCEVCSDTPRNGFGGFTAVGQGGRAQRSKSHGSHHCSPDGSHEAQKPCIQVSVPPLLHMPHGHLRLKMPETELLPFTTSGHHVPFTSPSTAR